VYTYQLIRYARDSFAYKDILKRDELLTKS
jgi:hypothetical protein